MNSKIDNLEKQAVEAAVSLQWSEAIELNKQILEIDPENIGANLRMAYALFQQGDISNSKTVYQRVLELQPGNQVAIEQINRLNALVDQNTKIPTGFQVNLNPNLFLDIPGKTKAVQLVQLGQKADLLTLVIGQKLELKEKKRRLEVRRHDGVYIGALPDDLSRRLIIFLDAGSVYEVYVKELKLPMIVVVFLREILKGDDVAAGTSFPDSTGPVAPRIFDDNDDETVESDEESEGGIDEGLDDSMSQNEDNEETTSLVDYESHNDEDEDEEE